MGVPTKAALDGGSAVLPSSEPFPQAAIMKSGQQRKKRDPKASWQQSKLQRFQRFISSAQIWSTPKMCVQVERLVARTLASGCGLGKPRT